MSNKNLAKNVTLDIYRPQEETVKLQQAKQKRTM